MPDESVKLLYEIHGKMQVLDERTQAIYRETSATNGRVTKLETNLSKLESDHGEKINTLYNRYAVAIGTATGISIAIGAVWSTINFIWK